MNNLFSDLSSNGLEEQKDTLGGFSLLDSNVYDAKIKVAYAGRSQSGAMNVTVHADVAGREYKETVYITNSDGNNFYYNKQDPHKKMPLPGYSTINDLCQVCTGKSLSQMETENKTLMVYSPELQKEVPTQVPVITELLGKAVKLGIIKEKRFKTQKTDNGYVDTDEVREANVINKVFNAVSGQTAYEIAHDLKEAPLFIDKWLEKNKGIISDRTKGKKPAIAAAPKQEPRKSLFA